MYSHWAYFVCRCNTCQCLMVICIGCVKVSDTPMFNQETSLKCVNNFWHTNVAKHNVRTIQISVYTHIHNSITNSPVNEHVHSGWSIPTIGRGKKNFPLMAAEARLHHRSTAGIAADVSPFAKKKNRRSWPRRPVLSPIPRLTTLPTIAANLTIYPPPSR